MSRLLTVALLQLRAFDLAQHREAWDDLLQHIDEAGALDPHPDLIVLPEASYPAYFLHSRATYDAVGVLPDSEVLGALAERARRHGTAIAAGLVLQGAEGISAAGMLENASVLFAPDGTVQGRTAKSFLWHFDREWFAPGGRYPVFDVAGGHAGLLVCADARLPEIPRALALGGAEVIVDCTAWVSSGRDPQTLSSPQVDYLVPARAIENGTWVVAADKCGTEAGTLVYAGRSGVCDPGGRWMVQAPADQPGVVLYTLDLEAARGAPVSRRPALYIDAAQPGATSRAAALARQPLAAETGAARVAAVALDASPSAVEAMERIRTLVRALAVQGTRLVVLPDLVGADPRGLSGEEVLPLIEALSMETGAMLAVVLAERDAGVTFKTLTLVAGGEVVGSHRQTHLLERDARAGFATGDTPPPVVESAFGNIGLLAGCEGLVPEVARGLKLRGAELLAWSAGDVGVPVRTLARARANEERLYVVAAGDTSESGGGYVVDPTGGVIGETLAGMPMAMSADVHRMLARWNDMAPGTNPVRDRRPESFSVLFPSWQGAAVAR
jgi:predicted amidohydrolase